MCGSGGLGGERRITPGWVNSSVYRDYAPHNPETVTHEFAEVLRGYGISAITGDKYAAGWFVKGSRRRGSSTSRASSRRASSTPPSCRS